MEPQSRGCPVSGSFQGLCDLVLHYLEDVICYYHPHPIFWSCPTGLLADGEHVHLLRTGLHTGHVLGLNALPQGLAWLPPSALFRSLLKVIFLVRLSLTLFHTYQPTLPIPTPALCFSHTYYAYCLRSVYHCLECKY